MILRETGGAGESLGVPRFKTCISEFLCHCLELYLKSSSSLIGANAWASTTASLYCHRVVTVKNDRLFLRLIIECMLTQFHFNLYFITSKFSNLHISQ